MTKGIAIQTILMLLVGILVVGIVVYMVYRYIFSPVINEQECRTRMVNWCTTCKSSGWSNTITPTANVNQCWDAGIFATGKPTDCSDLGGAVAYCSQFGVS